MRVRVLALLSCFATIPALQPGIQAQTPDHELPVSIERIRAGLREPHLLQIGPPAGDRPTFRVEVRAHHFVLQRTEEKAFDPTYGLPSIGELLMDAIENVRVAAVRYKRRHAERRARKEVDDDLAAFCAMHFCATPMSK